MIASIAFRRFKALRNTCLQLAPFNLVVGPNGSGKTSLIQAILQLRSLARLPTIPAVGRPDEDDDSGLVNGPEVTFGFVAPWDGFDLVMSCVREARCDALQVVPRATGGDPSEWGTLRERLPSVRAYLFDHYAIAQPSKRVGDEVLASNGGNLSSLLDHWSTNRRPVFDGFRAEVLRLFAEYDDLRVRPTGGETVTVDLRLREGGDWIDAEGLSQGTLYGLALCALAHDPTPPAIVCIEELDRGLHPRLLREVRDVVYQLSYPADMGLARDAVQVIATTHSPYLLDLFKDHPAEIVIAEKTGSEASFSRLTDRADLAEMLSEGSLGDMWFAGLLGGVPEDK